MTTHPIAKILLAAGLLSFAICAAATAAGKTLSTQTDHRARVLQIDIDQR
jgi:hypothetical protein